MEMSRNITLTSSSSSISTCSSVGTKNGCKAVVCHPLTTLLMNESGSKSLGSSPSLIKKEDGDSHNVIHIAVDTSGNAGTMKDSMSKAHTVPVGTSSETKENAITGSIISDDKSIKTSANTVNRSSSTESTEVTVEAKDIVRISDAIADIAANRQIRSRRKKRERTESTNIPQKIVPPRKTNHMPTLKNPPKIVTASMSNHYVPPRLQIGIGALKKSKSTEKNIADGGNNPESKVSVHMLNSVGLECGDDGKLILENFDDDDHARMCANTTDKSHLIKKEGGDGADAASAPQKPLPWTLDLHRALAAAVFEIGLKNCSPSIIMENMRRQPRYITRERTKSHLQKYRQTKQRSKGEFLKEFDAFFESTEEAKVLLNNDNSKNNLERKEPFTKAILTTALEGKKPSKLLGGKAAALLSYSVLNGFSTSHGPDQLQYKAAKLSEFPSLTEEEKGSSVGASLLQVKTLIDNMTDVLLKTRHGMKPFPVGITGTGDDESVSSSSSSSDDGYSDEEEDRNETGGRVDNSLVSKPGNKDQDAMVVPPAVQKPGGMFPIGAVLGAPTNPLYRPPPTGYPPPFPTQGAPPPPVAAGFPPPQYPHAKPQFYGSATPPPHLQATVTSTFGAPAAFHPQMHYPQDPRMNPYQQVPPAQVSSYPTVPPMQPNYYPTGPGYPQYYGGTNENTVPPVANTANYPSGDVYANQSQHGGDSHHPSRSDVYDQRSSSYSNDARSDRRSYDINEDSSDKRDRRRAEKRTKHRRRRSNRAESSLSMDTAERSDANDFGDFLDRLSKVPSPSKTSQKSSTSPVERSRHHGSLRQDSPMEKRERKRSRKENHHPSQHYQAAFDTPADSNSYSKNYGSPDDQFSEAGVRSFESGYEASPVRRAPPNRSQGQAHNDRQQQADNTGQFWESSNFEEASFNTQQQPQSSDGVSFHQQPAQLDAYGSGTEHQQQYLKSTQSSPDDGSARNYFFG